MELRLSKRFRQLRIKVVKESAYFLPGRRPRKILFDHLPKCAGSTLVSYLKRHYPARKVYSINGINPAYSIETFQKYSARQQLSYDLVVGHSANQLMNYIHPESLKITVLREPVDRIISNYYYVKRSPMHYLHWKIVESNLSLEDYVISGLNNTLRNWYTTYFTGLTIEEAEEDPKASVAKAIEIITQRYDIIGFVETFNLFIQALKEQANLYEQYCGKKINATNKRPSIQTIPQSTKDMIAELNYLDIDLYHKLRRIFC